MLIPRKKHSNGSYTWAVWNTKEKHWDNSPIFLEYDTKQECNNVIRYFVKEGGLLDNDKHNKYRI